MANILDTLHPENRPGDNIYPNVKKENIPQGSINFSKLSPEVVNALSGGPKIVNTEAYILALTSDKGLAVATDTGHFYYWNGTQYADGGVYLSNFGLYYKELEAADITLDSTYISGGCVSYNTYSILETTVSNDLLTAITTDDYTFKCDLAAFAAALGITLPDSSIVYLTKVSQATGTYTFKDIAEEPISAETYTFSASESDKRINVMFIHPTIDSLDTSFPDNKFFILFEKYSIVENIVIDESAVITGLAPVDLTLGIAHGGKALAGSITPELHQIIDGVEQPENLIKLFPSEQTYGGAVITTSATEIGWASVNGEAIPGDIAFKITNVLLPVGNYSYVLRATFKLMVGSDAYFGCGLLRNGESLIQVVHGFPGSTTSATANEEVTRTINGSFWGSVTYLKGEYIDKIDKGQCILKVKHGVLYPEETYLNVYYNFYPTGIVKDLGDLNGWLYVGEGLSFGFGSRKQLILIKQGEYYAIMRGSTFNYVDYRYTSNGESPGIYKYDGDIEELVMAVDTEVVAGSTNPVTGGAVDNALQQKQNVLTFDDTPTEDSNNPVTSKGTKEYVDNTKWVISSGKPLSSIEYLVTNGLTVLNAKLNQIGGMSYRSENLLQLVNIPETTANNLVYKVENGVITVNGTASSGVNLWVSLEYIFSANIAYAINFFPEGDHDGNIVYNVARTRSDLTNRVYETNNPAFTFNTTYKIEAICLQFDSGKTYNCTFKPMVIRGTTPPAVYSPYGIFDSTVTSVVSRGANLANVSFADITINKVTYVLNSDKTVTLSGTSSARSQCLIAKLSLPVGTYTLVNFGNNREKADILAVYTYQGQVTYIDLTGLTNNYRTFTLPAQVEVEIKIDVRTANINTSGTIVKPMLVCGSIVPTKYQAYRGTVDTLNIPSQIQSQGIGIGINANCYNYIDFERKKLVHKVSRVDLSTLNWDYVVWPNDPSKRYFQSTVALAKPCPADVIAPMLCTIYRNDSANNTYNNVNEDAISITNLGLIRICDNSYDDPAVFRAAVSEVYLYFETDRPRETDISTYLSRDTIKTDPEGTITFENTYKQAVPNTLTYLFEGVTLDKVVDNSGNAVDIAMTSDIPTVNDPTITFTQGGVTKGSITLNQATDQTIALDAGGSGGGSTVVANPTLSGNEATLNGLEVDGTKYKVGGSGGSGTITLDDIVDSQGNKRFIEGNGTPTTISGITPTYCKWSLSGSHLMLVYAGNVSANTIIDAKVILVSFELPEFINNKIFPTFGTNSIDNKKFIFYKSNGLIQEVSLLVLKSNNGIEIKNSPTTQTISNTGGFRLQFDLLIDSE